MMVWGVVKLISYHCGLLLVSTNSIDSMFGFGEREKEKAFIDRGRVFALLLACPPF